MTNYARQGIELDRSMPAAWVGDCSRSLAPLVEELGRYVRAADKVHANDTPVPVLEPGRGKTRTGRLWTYVRDDRPAGSTDPPRVWFRYSPDRKGERARARLKDFTGVLQAMPMPDSMGSTLTGASLEAGCWARVRRKFYDIDVNQPSPLAAEALRRMGEPYAVEGEIRGRLPVQRWVRGARAGLYCTRSRNGSSSNSPGCRRSPSSW